MPISSYLKAVREKVGSTLLVVPSVTGLVIEPDDRVLMVRHSNGNVWVAPGGAVDPDESPQDAVVREVWEEAGVVVEPVGFCGVYGWPESHVRYANGDEVTYVNSVFLCRALSGEPRPDGDETLEARYFPIDEVPKLKLSRWARAALPPLLERRGTCWIPPVTWRPPAKA